MTIKPLADKVVVKKLQAEETTKSGIILSSGAQQKPQIAEIIAVGPGGIVDGNEIKMEVQVGQKVIIRDYAGTNVKLEGEEYIIVRQDDIAAIVEDWSVNKIGGEYIWQKTLSTLRTQESPWKQA